MFGFFSRGVSALDQNGLAEFEELVFRRIFECHIPNFHFLSLRLQLAFWCQVGSVGKVGGLPNWWKRKQEKSDVLLQPRRIVGGRFSLPKEAGFRSLEFGISADATVIGSAAFQIDENVTQVRFCFPSGTAKPYPSIQGPLQVVPIDLADEKGFWEEQVRTRPVSEELSAALLKCLDEPEVSLEEGVVLAARPGEESASESTPAGSYRRLLNFSNGIRVNKLLIWGVGLPGQRTFEDEGAEYFYIGYLGDDLLALEIVDGTTSEEVHKLSHQRRSIVGTGKNVIELCELQL